MASEGNQEVVFGGIEGGGTTFLVTRAVGTPTNIVESLVIDTRDPKDTLKDVIDWLSARQPLSSVGVACFGPIDLCKTSPTYGYITTTPKLAWQNTNVLGALSVLGVPVGWETDVNAAALAEVEHGGHGAVATCAYVTVGTGVGVGLVTDGAPVHGALHPELGHMYPQVMKGDTAAGTCPFHGNCIEGFVSSGAIAARLGITPHDLATVSDEHEVWNVVAFYLAQLCVTIILCVSPNVIVLGGGVMHRLVLFPLIRAHVKTLLNGYIKIPQITDNIDKYIVPSILSMPGAVGSLVVAQKALASK